MQAALEPRAPSEEVTVKGFLYGLHFLLKMEVIGGRVGDGQPWACVLLFKG